MQLDRFLEGLTWRYACKKFDPAKKISDTTLSQLLEALRLSPSSFGLEPWKVFVITDPAVRAELRTNSWNQAQITDASHLLVLCNRLSIDTAYVDAFLKRVSETRGVPLTSLAGYRQVILGFLAKLENEQGAQWTAKQTYVALGTLLAACAVAKVDACPMEGFDAAGYDKVLGLAAEGLTAAALCTIGYRSADDDYAKAAKVRSTREEIVVVR